MKFEPWEVVWEITWKCNAKCIHCGSDCLSVEKDSELTLEECLSIVRQLHQLGTKRIILSGGDPMVRKDFPIIALAIKSLGMNVGFVSNGIAIDNEKIEILKFIQPNQFGLSLDSADEYIHDYIRGYKGCHKNVINSLKKFRENNIKCSVITTIHKLNYHQLPKLKELILDLGVKTWQIQYADLIGRTNKEMMVTEAQFYELGNFIYDMQQEHKEIVVTGADAIGYMSPTGRKILPNWQGCQAGCFALGIRSNGDITGCLSQQMEKYIEGNVRKNSLIDIWNNPNSFKYNRCFSCDELGGYCKECEHKEICRGGCSRASTTESDLRSSHYCLHKIEKLGFSSMEQARTIFYKNEIEQIYNPVKPLPEEFYNMYPNYEETEIN